MALEKYAVAIMSNFDSDNKVVIVVAENEIEAIVNAIVDFNRVTDEEGENSEAATKNWLKQFTDVKSLLEALYDAELNVSTPIRLENKNFVSKTLKDSELKLSCLEEAGVDNWSGYSDAMETYEELKSDSKGEIKDGY